MIGRKISWHEVEIYAELVANHFARCRRNPTDAEVDEMLATLRIMSDAGTEYARLN